MVDSEFEKFADPLRSTIQKPLLETYSVVQSAEVISIPLLNLGLLLGAFALLGEAEILRTRSSDSVNHSPRASLGRHRTRR